MSYNFCTGKIHGYGDSTQSWPTSDRQDETSTIESETQRPRQTRFQLLERSESQKYSSADDPLYGFFRTYLSVNLIRVTVVCKLIFNNIVSYNHKSLFKLYIYQKSPYNHFIYFLHRQKYLYQN